MIKIPSLPFASSIVGGEHHADIKPENETVFNIGYFAKLYMIHKTDIPQLLSEKMTNELTDYANRSPKNLVALIFDRQLQAESQGVICTPLQCHLKDRNAYATLAYQFVPAMEMLAVTVSILADNSKETIDCPFFAFTAERLPDSMDIGIRIPMEVATPLMSKQGRTETELSVLAWSWVKLIYAYEAMNTYKCIRFNSFHYDAMLKKNDVYLNPNFVSVDLLMLEGEKMNLK